MRLVVYNHLMHICVVGTGYVGLVSGTCLAHKGHTVTCVDTDTAKIDRLQRGESPLHEPKLEALIQEGLSSKHLAFITELNEAVEQADLCMICVGTPALGNGQADLSSVEQVAKELAIHAKKPLLVILKSTVPVGTCQAIQTLIANQSSHPITVVSNPEFLKQGEAVHDGLNPSRIIAGFGPQASEQARQSIQHLYQPWVDEGVALLMMDWASAEMAKYAANAYLAMRISFINELSELAKCMGADPLSVRNGLIHDPRIGGHGLYPGLGYGGSCFPKDLKSLEAQALLKGHTPTLIQATQQVNRQQRYRFLNQVLERFDGTVRGLTLAIWGLAFKPNTDDMREAPSLTICQELLAQGARLQVYDPQAMPNALKHFGHSVVYARSQEAALEGADALLVLTEWPQFTEIPASELAKRLNQPVVLDGRYCLKYD